MFLGLSVPSNRVLEEKRHALYPYRWAVLTAALLTSAQGGVPCAPRAVVLQSLQARFGEVLIARGLATGGTLVEVLANDKGTWTMLFTRPEGISCMVLTGEAWERVEPKPPADPEVRQ